MEDILKVFIEENCWLSGSVTMLHFLMNYLQFGILIPAGMPDDAKLKTSRDVKSGRRNVSFSYSFGQGRRGRKDSAFSTKEPNFALISLLTIATNPLEKTSKEHQSMMATLEAL